MACCVAQILKCTIHSFLKFLSSWCYQNKVLKLGVKTNFIVCKNMQFMMSLCAYKIHLLHALKPDYKSKWKEFAVKIF